MRYQTSGRPIRSAAFQISASSVLFSVSAFSVSAFSPVMVFIGVLSSIARPAAWRCLGQDRQNRRPREILRRRLFRFLEHLLQQPSNPWRPLFDRHPQNIGQAKPVQVRDPLRSHSILKWNTQRNLVVLDLFYRHRTFCVSVHNRKRAKSENKSIKRLHYSRTHDIKGEMNTTINTTETPTCPCLYCHRP